MKHLWDTPQVRKALRKAFPTKSVVNDGQGGDYDTDNMRIFLSNEEAIYICGFNIDQEGSSTTPHGRPCTTS